MQIMKKPIDIASVFTFFHNLGHNLAQIYPQDHNHFNFKPTLIC